MQECKKHKNDTDNRGEGVGRLLANFPFFQGPFFKNRLIALNIFHCRTKRPGEQILPNQGTGTGTGTRTRTRRRRANQRKHGLQGGSEMTIDVEKQVSQRVDQCENSKNWDIQ